MRTNAKPVLSFFLALLFVACLVSFAAGEQARGNGPEAADPGNRGGSVTAQQFTDKDSWTAWYKDPRPKHGPEYHGVAVCPDGSIVAAGTDANFNGAGNTSEMMLGKYDRDGRMLTGWPKLFSKAGMRWNEGQSVFVEANGNITVGGYMITSGNVWYLAIWRFNSKGKPLSGWPRYMKVDNHSFGTAATVVPGGNIIACGYTDYWTGTAWNQRLLLVEYRPNGTLAWSRTYQVAPGQGTVGFDLILDSDGRIVVAGYTEKSGTNRDAVLYKLDRNGDLITGWPRVWSAGPGYDEYSSVSQDKNGDYCLVGVTQGATIGPVEDTGKLLVTRYAKGGKQLASSGWPKVYPVKGILGYHPPDVWHGCVDPSGNIVAAMSGQSDAGVNTVKYDNGANMAPGFPKVLNRKGYLDETHSCCTDDEGNIYVVGFSYSDTDEEGDYSTFVAKYPPAYNWYLAEGSTGANEFGSFETWILVQNPGDDEAEAQLYYQTPTREVTGQKLTLKPHTRQTVNVSDFVPNEFSVSTRVDSSEPVIAERAMYWSSLAGIYRQAAHDSIGYDP